jgi:16S rRNA (guanine(1405)-N(7))-methyltransferase
MNDALANLESQLRASRKYRHLCADTIRRIAEWAHARHSAPHDAIKAAKRKLHQVFAAYCLPDRIGQLAAQVDELPAPSDLEAHRAGCRQILRQHASTAERMEWLDLLYERLWSEIGLPRRVLDLACGYHPFSLPWMGLEGAEYFCCEIDERLVAAANTYLTRLGREATATCMDLLARVPTIEADVALLFKTVPCLLQQEEDSALTVLRSLNVRWAVVSFPLESLGGKARKMREHYGRVMESIASALGIGTRTLEYPNEIFYLLELRADRR